MHIIKPEPSNMEKLGRVKEVFEARFGKDTATRNPEQWRNLVQLYGMETVCQTEDMSEKEVKKKMRGK